MLWLIEIFTSILWLGCLIKYGALTSALPLKQRVQSAFFTFVLTVGSTGSIDSLFWGILHPQQIPQCYFRQVGIFPSWLTFFAWLGSGLSGLVALSKGFAIAQRKASGRSVIWWIPFFTVFAVMDMVQGCQIRRNFRSATEVFGFFVVFVAVAGCFYGWMYFFYKSRKMDGYFLAPNSTDPPANSLSTTVSD
jgi:hypothetical protein